MQFCSVMSFLDKNYPLTSTEVARPPGGKMRTENTIGLVEELEIEYSKDIYNLQDDVAYSIFLCQKRLQWAGHVVRMDDPPIPHKSNERMFREEGGSLGRPRGMWEVASATGAVGFLHIRKWKEAAREDKVGGRRSGKPQA